MQALNAKSYSDRLPSLVTSAMVGFTGSDCYLIKRNIQRDLHTTVASNCHQNVKLAVEAYGGRMINGWLLFRVKKFNELGIYTWAFHSIWEKASGELLDITESQYYAGSEYSTFWHDARRAVDLIQGINYNCVMVFSNSNSAAMLGNATNTELLTGTPYWTTEDMKMTMPIDKHSGQYKWLLKDYPENIKQFETELNGKVTDGKFVANNPNAVVPSSIAFDYGIRI